MIPGPGVGRRYLRKEVASRGTILDSLTGLNTESCGLLLVN